jgi:murein DD-endopeptidase MepM/ murein hydrolase activator NlpD
MQAKSARAVVVAVCLVGPAAAAAPKSAIDPPLRAVDLKVGESAQVELAGGKKVQVKLLEMTEQCDPIRQAVRRARVHVEADGRRVWLTSANYELPVMVGGVQIDCPVTRALYRNSGTDAWGLDKDARLRLWPAGSPWINPGTFVYPVRQRWMASSTQMANEPCFVDAAETLRPGKIYYHWGLDFGGCEGLTEVVAATDGLVVSSGKEVLPGYKDTPVSPRYDVVYLLDGRGWYCRYSHFHSIEPGIRPGVKVQMGQRLGLLGKEGGSGGWTHLHFDIYCRQPSGKWGCQEAYAFAWEAYRGQHRPELVAVARPHLLVLTGEKVRLEGTRSWSARGKIARYAWEFTDGTAAEGATVERTYTQPGYHSEVLRVTDSRGRVACDCCVVVAVDREHRDRLPPSVHVTYFPTLGIRPGDVVTLKGRTFGTQHGEETWEFGDGGPGLKTRSDGNAVPLAKDGYVTLTHRYAKPGIYPVRVERTDAYGQKGVGYVFVEVEASEGGSPP